MIFTMDECDHTMDSPHISAPSNRIRSSSCERAALISSSFSCSGSVESEHGDSAENDVAIVDNIVQSQLAILEHIKQQNELRRREAVASSPSADHPAPLQMVSVPSRTNDVQEAPQRATSPVEFDESDILRSQEILLEKFRKQKEERERQQQQQQRIEKETRDAKETESLQETLSGNSIIKPCPPLQTKAQQSPPSQPIPSLCDLERNISSQDVCARLGKKKIIVRGTDNTYKAIQSGASMVVNCLACDKALQVPVTAKAVYCTCCHHISSIETSSASTINL